MSTLMLEDSPLWIDVQDILKPSDKKVHFEYRGMFHTVKEDIPMLKILSIDIIRDYATNIGDQINIEFKLPLGDYVARLYPYRFNLEVTIKQIELEETTTIKKPNTIIKTERYKAIFLPTANPAVSASDSEMTDIESLNKINMVDVKLQLVNRALEVLRIKTVCGIFKQVTQEKLIHSVLMGESNKILIDGKPAVKGMDIVTPDNLEVRKHTIIPTGLHITALPTYLQDAMGGVYIGGIGTYLQTYKDNSMWFIYPLFDLNRFDKNVDKAIIYGLPKERFPSLNRTYKKTASIVTILATSERQYKDSADTDYMNHGSGFRMSDARPFMKKPIVITEEGPKGDRTGLNHEVSHLDRGDNLNYGPMVLTGSSSNPYREYSKLSARNVSRIDFVWENADYSLIYPGMPCKYVFLSKEKQVEIKGVILFVHAFTALQGHGITASDYRTMCQISIVCENYKHTPEIPITKSVGDF